MGGKTRQQNHSVPDGTDIFYIQFFYPYPVPNGTLNFQQSTFSKKTGSLPGNVLVVLKFKYF